MKNKKIIFGVVAAVFLLGVFSFVTMQFKDAYAINENIVDGFTSIYIPEGTTASPGERVNVELDADTSMWDCISIAMRSTTSNDEFVVYLKNLNSSDPNDLPYFILPEPGNVHSNNPEGVKVGETYELREIFLGNLSNSSSAKEIAFYNLNGIPFMDLGNKKYVEVKSGNQVNESKVKLNSFNLKTNKAKIYDVIDVDINYTGDCSYGYLGLVDQSTGNWVYLTISDLNTNPYIYLDEYSWFNDGVYKVQTLTLTDQYGVSYDFVNPGLKVNGAYVGATEFQFNSEIELTRGENKTKVDLKNITLDKTTAEINDKVNVNIDSDSDLASVLLTFNSNDGSNNSINAYVKSLNNNPYIIVPFNSVRGQYYLSAVVLKDKAGNMSYYKFGTVDTQSQFLKDFIYLKIGNDMNSVIDKSVAYINNLDYNSRILSMLDEINDDAIITVDASSNPIISHSLFEVIRETRRTLIIQYYDSEWVFSGTDIVNPKSINVSMVYEKITDKNINNSQILNDLDKQSLMLMFANNGDLPGKALIRLKATEIDDMFSGESLYIYFSDQDTLAPVAMEVQKDNGYYDFYIDHNSKYILTKKKLTGSYVTSDNKYLKLNTKNSTIKKDDDNDNFLLKVCGLVIALLIVVVILLVLRKKK